ncbi:LPD1 domain-containing protein [Acinetobacter junii]|uniref:LPD1 domain-containing protein n=1 Tax=Acinetobacter junii TaxID=40215 RepID=UPI0034CE0A2B
MKWLNLENYGLNVGFRHPTKNRDKLAIVSINDIKRLNHFFDLDQFQLHMESIGFNRVNSENSYPKFVKADNKIQPSLFRKFLNIDNSNIVEMPESNAIARLKIDKDQWLSFSKSQNTQKEFWFVDSKVYAEKFKLESFADIEKQFNEFNKNKDERFIDLSFENPLPIDTLKKYGYDSKIFGVITSDKSMLMNLGFPESAFKKADLSFVLPVSVMENKTLLAISNIKETPEILEYSADSWQEAIKVQNALPEIAKITQNLKNFIESPDEEFIDSLLLEIKKFHEKDYVDVLSHQFKAELADVGINNSNQKLETLLAYIHKIDIYNELDSNKLELIKKQQQNFENIEHSKTTDVVIETIEKGKNRTADRIEDYGENVFGARKHFYENRDSTLLEIEKDRNHSFEILVDKYKKSSLWNFKKETLPQLEDKSNELFFFAQSIYNMIPNKLSMAKIDKNKPEIFIQRLKDYSKFVGHFKEIIQAGIDLHDRYPLSAMTNMLVNYKNVIDKVASNPQQFYFDDLDPESPEFNDSSRSNIREFIKGVNRKSSNLSKTMSFLEDVKVGSIKVMVNTINEDTSEIDEIYFRRYVETGGEINHTNQLSKYEIPPHAKLENAFYTFEKVTGQDGFFQIIRNGSGFKDQIQKVIEKLNLSLEIQKNITPEKEISYFRASYDLNYKDLELNDLENKSDNVISESSIKITERFDLEYKKQIKQDQPERLDLRYPQILQNLTHETSTDYRNSEDVTVDDFGRNFAFRAVQFGNWVTQNERQELLNITYDGLSELKNVLNLTDSDISFNGELAIAFGARGRAGRGAAAAHYEPYSQIFNLTKVRGAGSVSHEWFHSLDHYAARVLEEQTKKLVYKSGSFNAVEKNYYLSELMADVDYESSKYIIDSNPILKSFYNLQKKLNGKMEADEIFTKEGINLIKVRSEEVIENSLQRLIIKKDQLINAVREIGKDDAAQFLNKTMSEIVDSLYRLKTIELDQHYKNPLFIPDLRLHQSNTASMYRAIGAALRKDNISFGRYTLSNPITEESNRLLRAKNEVGQESIASTRELYSHLRLHRNVKGLENEIHAVAFQIIQSQILPLAISELIRHSDPQYNKMKERSLRILIDRAEAFFKINSSKNNNDLSLDAMFNKNNFASKARLLDVTANAYWSRTCEKFARCGEALVTDLFKEKGVSVGYIVQCMEDPKTNGERSGITPSGQDRVEILQSYKETMQNLREYVFKPKHSAKNTLEVNAELENSVRV